MHYKSDAFSNNGNATIIPIYGANSIIGQRVGGPVGQWVIFQNCAHLFCSRTVTNTMIMQFNTPSLCTKEQPTVLDLIKVRLRYQCMNHKNESSYRALLTYPIPLSADDNAPDQ